MNPSHTDLPTALAAGNCDDLFSWLSHWAGGPVDVGGDPLIAAAAKMSPPDSICDVMKTIHEILPGELQRGNPCLALANRGCLDAIDFLVKNGCPFRGDQATWFFGLFRPNVSPGQRQQIWNLFDPKDEVAKGLCQKMATAIVCKDVDETWNELIGLTRQELGVDVANTLFSSRLGNIFALILRDGESEQEHLGEPYLLAQSLGILDQHGFAAAMGKLGFGNVAASFAADLIAAKTPEIDRAAPGKRL